MGETATLAHPAAYQEAVAASVAERLKTLGHPADMLTQGALEALVAHAGGSIARLRAALTSAIFLAATEDSPRIERDHVERAVEPTGPDTTRTVHDPLPAGLAGPRRRAGFVALGAGGAMAAFISLIAISRGPGAGRTAPVQTPPATTTIVTPASAGAGPAGTECRNRARRRPASAARYRGAQSAAAALGTGRSSVRGGANAVWADGCRAAVSKR